MSTIVIATLPELGHLNSTLKLARSLASRGHHVYYLCGSDYKAYMQAQGMRFICLGETMRNNGTRFSQLDLMESLMELRFNCRPLDKRLTAVVQVFRQEIEALVQSLQPDLFIIDPFVPDVTLIAHQLAVPFVFLNTTLFNPLEGTALLKNTPYLAQVPELVLCPGEFDFPQVAASTKNRYYCGAEVDLQRREEPFAWEKIDSGKPLIYCSFGSQAEIYPGVKRFFQILIEAVADMPHRQMILATGANFNHDSFESVPANVLPMNHAPQLQILERTNVLITHGGLNSIKEALLFGIPMIVFPSFVDQPMNAARIVYHGLGVTADMANLTVEQARMLIERVAETQSFRERAASFREIFRNLEEAEVGVKVIETLLASVAKKRCTAA